MAWAPIYIGRLRTAMAMRAMPSLRLKVFMPATLHSGFHTEVDVFHIFTVFNDCKYTKINNN
jgi:hypothetical protein